MPVQEYKGSNKRNHRSLAQQVEVCRGGDPGSNSGPDKNFFCLKYQGCIMLEKPSFVTKQELTSLP